MVKSSTSFKILYFKLKERLNSNKAFTLAELLLASAILAFVLSGLLMLFYNIKILNDASRNQFSALTHAEFVMEEIKNTNFSSIAADIQDGDWDWNSGTITSKGLMPLTNEQIDTSVSGSSVLDITVTVSWLDRGNRQRSIALSTKMAAP